MRTLKTAIIGLLAAALLFTPAHARMEESAETVQAVEAVPEPEELTVDSRGDAVKALQKQLRVLGFYTAAVDGIYGANTQAAVRELEEYVRLIERRDIEAMIAAMSPEPTVTPGKTLPEESVVAVATPDPTPSPSPTPAPTPQTVADGVADTALQALAFGDVDALYLCDVDREVSGIPARRVQRRLVVLNYLNDMADGIFGVNSQTALTAFQEANGLTPTGTADIETQRLLFSEQAAAAKRPVYNQLTMGASGDRVAQVQKQLIILGFMNGSATGYYDRATRDGVMALENYLYLIDHPEIRAAAPAQPAAAVVDAAALSEEIPADSEKNPYEVMPEIESAADAAGFQASGVMSHALQIRLLEDGILVYSDIVRRGEKGDNVLRLQRRLYSLGYLTASGVDGVFGSGTESAVKKFQERNRMEKTGLADQTMQYVLFSEDAVKSVKPYQIKVSLSEQKVFVYSPDAYDNYTVLVKQFVCSTGTKDHPTPKGTFTNTGRGARWHYFVKFDCWAQYAFYVDGDIMIHSVLFDAQDEKTLRGGSVSALGSRASHGCIRLAVKDAKWIWDHCTSGTAVVVY